MLYRNLFMLALFGLLQLPAFFGSAEGVNGNVFKASLIDKLVENKVEYKEENSWLSKQLVKSKEYHYSSNSSLPSPSKSAVLDEVIVVFKPAKLDLKKPFAHSQAMSFASANSLTLLDSHSERNFVVYRIQDNQSLNDLISELSTDPAVDYVQPNYRYDIFAEDPPNDTEFNRLWGLRNIGQSVNGITGTAGADIDILNAWELSGGEDIIVAVIDTGVAHQHPDLIGSMWDGTTCLSDTGAALGDCIHGYDFEDNDKDPAPTSSSHGTHIAGTIAAVKNNNTGIVGVAPQAKIMALKTALFTSEIVKAISFAEHNGAQVINASWGGTANDLTLRAAIESFDGLFVAAAGNRGLNHNSSPLYPCSYNLDNIICVAATDQNDALASFSDFGSVGVDLGAPGVNIYSTLGETVILNQSFEGITVPTLPAGWVAETNPLTWGTQQPGGSWGRALYGDINRNPYTGNVSNNLTLPVIDLSGADILGAVVEFRAQCDTQYDDEDWFDYMSLYFSSNGSSFTEIARWDEYTLDDDENPAGPSPIRWLEIGIAEQYLTANFTLRFRWTTDGSDNNYEGCIVDDLSIKKFTDGAGETYGFLNGTSMAAPHVAGAAALLWAKAPTASIDSIKELLMDGGDDLAALSGKTVSGKRLNAFTSLGMLEVNNPVITSPAAPVTVNASYYPIIGTAPAGSLVKAYRGETEVGRHLLGGEETDFFIITSLQEDSVNNISVIAENSFSGQSEAVVVPAITTDSNEPALPAPTLLNASAITALTQTSFTVQDNEGTQYVYLNPLGVLSSVTALNEPIVLNGTAGNNYSIRVMSRDGDGWHDGLEHSWFVLNQPTASPVAGTYTSAQSVTLASAQATKIRYTTNGSNPACVNSGSTYSSAISVGSSQTIRAIACDAQDNATAIASFAYTINIPPPPPPPSGGENPPTVTNCTSVSYGAWGTCSTTGTQTRQVISQLPANCTLTNTQTAAMTQSCTIEPQEPEQPMQSQLDSCGTGNTLEQFSCEAGITGRSAEEIAAAVGMTRSLELEQSMASIRDKVVPEGTSNELRETILLFITYGTGSTKALGAGERGGVVNSFLAAHGRLPDKVSDWEDIMKLANGRWPATRNLVAEQRAVTGFNLVYKRNPDMNNPKDNAAVTIMAYGMRPVPRNTNSELAALSIYRSIFKNIPDRASYWDTLRAIAYSGAVR